MSLIANCIFTVNNTHSKALFYYPAFCTVLKMTIYKYLAFALLTHFIVTTVTNSFLKLTLPLREDYTRLSYCLLMKQKQLYVSFLISYVLLIVLIVHYKIVRNCHFTVGTRVADLHENGPGTQCCPQNKSLKKERGKKHRTIRNGLLWKNSVTTHNCSKAGSSTCTQAFD